MPQVSLNDLVAGVQAGQLIAFPTDTVPALAAHPTAAAAIYAAKQRSHQKPLILMGATAADLWPFVQENLAAQPIWETVANQYWPGAVTLVLPASDRLPSAVNPENPTTIGLRVPNCPLAIEILRQTGPLATTSLNRSDHPPLEDLAAIAVAFPSVLTPTDALWQLPPTGDRIPSTVAQWDGQGWTILRQGAISLTTP